VDGGWIVVQVSPVFGDKLPQSTPLPMPVRVRMLYFLKHVEATSCPHNGEKRQDAASTFCRYE
jgi:hypothetical protein